MITCPACSVESYQGALFCGGCGGPLVAAARPDPARRAGVKIPRPRPDAPSPDLAPTGPRAPITEQPTRRLSPETLLPGDVVRRLRVSVGDRTTEFEIEPGGEIVIGRSAVDGLLPDIDLEAAGGFDLGVSRRHAAVRNVRQGLVMIDRNSSNGTWLAGRRLTAGYAYLLPERAAARFGDLLVNLTIAD